NSPYLRTIFDSKPLYRLRCTWMLAAPTAPVSSIWGQVLTRRRGFGLRRSSAVAFGGGYVSMRGRSFDRRGGYRAAVWLVGLLGTAAAVMLSLIFHADRVAVWATIAAVVVALPALVPLLRQEQQRPEDLLAAAVWDQWVRAADERRLLT